MLGGSNVFPIRRAARPPDSLADKGGRGAPIVAPLTSSHPRYDAHADGFAPDGFEPIEGFRESFVCTDALDSAHGVYAWVIGFFIFDAVMLAAGIWVWG